MNDAMLIAWTILDIDRTFKRFAPAPGDDFPESFSVRTDKRYSDRIHEYPVD